MGLEISHEAVLIFLVPVTFRAGILNHTFEQLINKKWAPTSAPMSNNTWLWYKLITPTFGNQCPFHVDGQNPSLVVARHAYWTCTLNYVQCVASTCSPFASPVSCWSTMNLLQHVSSGPLVSQRTMQTVLAIDVKKPIPLLWPLGSRFFLPIRT